jgi:hypothetical protein
MRRVTIDAFAITHCGEAHHRPARSIDYNNLDCKPANCQGEYHHIGIEARLVNRAGIEREVLSGYGAAAINHNALPLASNSRFSPREQMEIKPESCPQKASRKTRNLWVRCKSLGQTTNVQAKLALKEAQLIQCKKSFGVAYMDLIEKGTSGEDLRSCVEACRLKIEGIRSEISLLRDRKAYIREKAQNRILRNSRDWGTPSVRVTPNSSSSSLSAQVPNNVASWDYPNPTWECDDADVQNVTFDTSFEPSAPPASYDWK